MNHGKCTAEDFCELYQGKTEGVCYPTDEERAALSEDKTDGKPVGPQRLSCPHYAERGR